MITRIVSLTVVLCGLAGCATAREETLPAVGTALQATRDAHTTLCNPELYAALQNVRAQLCQAAVVAEPCVDVQRALDKAQNTTEAACEFARVRLNEAIDIYTTINTAAGGE